LDLAAWLIARHLGRAVADKALHILLAEGARPANAPQPHVVIDRQARDPRLEAAVNFIDQNLAQPPRIEDVAKRVGLSRRQLERLFRDEFGMSPWKYALGRRLRHGHLLLTQTRHSITNIAHECGFADASHFSRHVRTTFGAPPQTVRDAAAHGADRV
jgi:transcriptional regulator GlxA family with amidase domain